MIAILDTTTKNPLQLIGSVAGCCWNSDVNDAEKNKKRALDCINSDHGRVLEFVTIDLVIEGYSARVIREYMRHVGGGLTVLQESTRYVDCKNFKYTTPPSVEKNLMAKDIYTSYMNHCANTYESLIKLGVPKEDVAMILPLGMHTKLVDHKNLRNLSDMSKKRLCNRAFWEYRILMKDIIKALNDYSEEWNEITKLLFRPQCEILGRCPEAKPCGKLKGVK